MSMIMHISARGRKRILLVSVVLLIVLAGWFRHTNDGDASRGRMDKKSAPSALGHRTERSNDTGMDMRPEDGGTPPDTVSAVETPEQADLDLPLPSLSQLSRREQEKAFSLMMDDYRKWQSVRTVTADITVREGFLNSDEQLSPGDAGMLTAKLKAEVIPLQKKEFDSRMKLRIRIEIEDLGIVILTENAYDRDTPPVAWHLAGTRLSEDDILSYRRDIFPVGAIPWEAMFRMVDAANDDFREMQEMGLASLDDLQAGNRWRPIRTSSPQEEQAHFEGRRQYLFHLAPVRLSRYWFDANSGDISMYEVPDYTGQRDFEHRIRFGQYVEHNGAHFPCTVTSDIHNKEHNKVWRTDAVLSNVKLNEEIPSTDLVAPSRAVPMKD